LFTNGKCEQLGSDLTGLQPWKNVCTAMPDCNAYTDTHSDSHSDRNADA
jgi:hypothetical protein